MNGPGRAGGAGRPAGSGAGWRTAVVRALLAGAGAAAARSGWSLLHRGTARRQPPPLASVWRRTNFRGAQVSLAAGPAVVVAGAVAAAAGAPGRAAAAAALTAGLGAGGVGLYDDLVGHRPGQGAKGFHGHLAALRRGEVTSGVVKIVGVGAAGLVAAVLLEAGPPGHSGEAAGRWRTGARVALGAGLVAGAANLLNLLDLRPGRALKVALLAGVPLAVGPAGGLAAGPTGACAGLLPVDLAERTMLGDGGANGVGALLGVALAARTDLAGRAAALAVIGGLTAASERVSFTRVIAATPVLREIDNLGRRPDPAPHQS